MLKSKSYRYKEEKIKGKYVQSFKYIENEYALNKEKTNVVVVGSFDIRDKLDSYKDSCLNIMLEKFLGNNIEVPVVRKRKLTFEDYDSINKYLDELRKKYNLSEVDFPSIDSVLKQIDILKSDNLKKINESQDKLIKKSQVSKEEENNEKAIN